MDAVPTYHTAAARTLIWLRSSIANQTVTQPMCPVKLLVLATLCSDAIRPETSGIDVVEYGVRMCSSLSLHDVLRNRGELTLLCCLAQLRRIGKPLANFAAFIEGATDTLGGLPEDEREPYLPSYLLLEQLGMRLPAPPERSPPRIDTFALLTGDGTTSRKSIRDIEITTRFGIRHWPALADSGVIFGSLMMSALRRYDLGTASALLRALCYLRIPEDLAQRTARHFLLNHQNFAGGFGFFSETFGQPVGDGQLASSELHFDLAFQCLWALVESEAPHYRLYRDFGRYSAASD